ncbi:hypothetical protein EST38_g13877 [Candolleomyces aberdarensis]|uniref:Uncharacterized protein n=1 Tax=Candolleomyces aberdarensis TaxID=2316362 RepID=A0A4Q2CZP5_9AGAR|nr:hypothetical protein EST38_g13877 [Candolleomyces aberdarensis]
MTQPEKVPSLAHFLEEGYQIVKFDGTARLVVDNTDSIHAAIIPCPEALAKANLNGAFVEAMNDAQTDLDFSASNTTTVDDCNRGNFQTITTGISHGGGQKEPQNLNLTPKNSLALSTLSGSSAIRAIAWWQSKCYQAWMPRFYAYNANIIERLKSWKPTLLQNFASSIYGSVTYNFGPSVLCDFHTDHLNWIAGMCAITSGGNYNYQEGGHLALREFKLILEFPPCATILISSAMVTHGNLPIAAGES